MMTRTWILSALLIVAGLPFSASFAQSGELDLSKVPGVVVAHSPATTKVYLGSPSICILPDGTYLAKCDLFGKGAPQENGPITRVFRSDDRGKTWTHLCDVEQLFWASVFAHRGAVYLLGTGGQSGREVVIRRSTDGGLTWTVPKDEETGRLRAEGVHHCAPTPVIEHEGRLWRGMEVVVGRGWGHPFRAMMMSIPVDADLLDASAWTFSDAIPSDPNWLDGDFGGWLEGNAVPTPDGHIANILRVHYLPTGGKAALVEVSDDGRQSQFDPNTGFIDCPGGCKKLNIRFDPVSKLYWNISNWIPPWDEGGNPERTRNTMALSSSEDLRHWTVKTILVYHPDLSQHGFQYIDWVFDGKDIVALSRTACDDGLGGAHNQHDANFLTFHRIADFRKRTMDDSAEVERIEEVIAETDDFTALGYGFETAPFGEGLKAFGNRDYVWKNVPAQVASIGSFTRTNGGERGRIFIRAKRDCTIYAATARGVGAYEMLKWERVEGAEFCYTDKGETGMQVYSRHFKAGEQGCVQQCSWTGTIVFLPKGSQEGNANSIGMRMIPLKPGSFDMGSVSGDWDETPVREVAIARPFAMSATEVTNAQYEQYDPKHKALRGKLEFSKEDDEAVVFVSWHDAVAFCDWLSKKEGKPYRLPTEAEWEYACRAGTTPPYHTGKELPESFHKNVGQSWYPGKQTETDIVPLHVGKTPPNPWGLFDMHGNVEEWCLDWYGPYQTSEKVDPVGVASGDFRVTRGGSHSTKPEFLRSANRSGTLPDDRSWLIGFRVVQADLPDSTPVEIDDRPRNARNVAQEVPANLTKGPDPTKPFFRGPRVYVKEASSEDCPYYNRHNHCPAIVNCPNGDLLAIWYTCAEEWGRELGIVASRLPYGEDEWQTASSFWNAPDRNDHASALWVDEKGKIYHFNGLGAAATWGALATIMRTSTDNGATWSKARLIMPEHGLHHMPIESVVRTKEGAILVPCDAVTGGNGGSALLVSRNNGETWVDPGEGRPQPTFEAGTTGAWIAGIHAGFVQRTDGTLVAFGRGNTIDGHMPMSLSTDLGKNWTYSASPFQPLGGGQRLVVLRLQEGPILFCSFAKKVRFQDAAGTEQVGSGLFAALTDDEGKSWEIKRLITDDGPAREVDGGGNTREFTMSPLSAEPRGYMSICQAENGIIHLISSKQHYAFNLCWLQTPPPVPPKADTTAQSTRHPRATSYAPRSTSEQESDS